MRTRPYPTAPLMPKQEKSLKHRRISATARTYAPSSAATPGVLSLEEAKKNWVKALSGELAYVYPSDLDPEKDSPVLAYVPSFSAADRYVNALTGEVDSWK